MTDAQIDALGAPPYKRAIYTALAHYGAYVGDCPTNGAPCTPLTAYFHQMGDPGWNGSNYDMDFSDVDWSTYGEFLDAPPG